MTVTKLVRGTGDLTAILNFKAVRTRAITFSNVTLWNAVIREQDVIFVAL